MILAKVIISLRLFIFIYFFYSFHVSRNSIILASSIRTEFFLLTFLLCPSNGRRREKKKKKKTRDPQ